MNAIESHIQERELLGRAAGATPIAWSFRMKTEIVRVTPLMAREWLKRNSHNRPFRPRHIETLRDSFSRGEYVVSHQGVAFASDGDLIDGQHRLAAIAMLPDTEVFPMLVTRGLDRDTVFPVVDAIQAKRTTSDVLGIDRGIGECAKFFAKVYAGRAAMTPTYIQPFADFVSIHLPPITSFCSRHVKTWTSAPVRAAAIVASVVGDPDYVKLVYSALASADFNAMPPIAQAMYRAHLAGKVRASQAYDIFARCIKVFDEKNARLSRVQINDQAQLLVSVRELLDAEVYGAVKKTAAAPPRRADKSVLHGTFHLEGL